MPTSDMYVSGTAISLFPNFHAAGCYPNIFVYGWRSEGDVVNMTLRCIVQSADYKGKGILIAAGTLRNVLLQFLWNSPSYIHSCFSLLMFWSDVHHHIQLRQIPRADTPSQLCTLLHNTYCYWVLMATTYMVEWAVPCLVWNFLIGSPQVQKSKIQIQRQECLHSRD